MKKLSLLLAVIMVLSATAVPTIVFADDAGYTWKLVKGSDFNSGYSATESSSSFPSGFSSTLGKSKAFATTIDEAHGVSVNVISANDGPWFALDTRDLNDTTVETYLLKYSFDFYPKVKGPTNFHGLGQKSDGSGRAFNNFIQLAADGKVNFLNGTSATYDIDKWYSAEIVVDIPNQKYTIYFGESGSALAKVVDEVTLPTPWRNVISFRLTTSGANTNLVYDNFFAYKAVYTPNVTDAQYSKSDNKINITFSKDMDANSFTNETVALTAGSENLALPFTGEYSSKVYTISPASALPENMECRVKINGVECVDDLTISNYSYTIDNGTGFVKNSNVSFQPPTSTNIVINVTLPSSLLSTVKNTVYCAYKGDMLVDYYPTDSVSGDVTLLGNGIDGAVVYFLGNGSVPVCDAVVMGGSRITSGVRSATLPEKTVDYTYDVASDKITVFGKSTAGKLITVISNKSDEASLTGASAIRQTVAKENGYWEVTFVNDVSKVDATNYKFPSDTYNIHVISDGFSSKLEYQYSNSSEAREAMGVVTSANSKDDLEDIIERFSKVFALNLEKYNTLSKDNIHDFILTEPLSTFTEGSQFKYAFERSVFLEMLNTDAFTWNDVKTYGTLLGITDEEISDIADSDFVVKLLKDTEYTDRDDFSERFAEVAMLCNITNAPNSSTMKTLVLDTYDDVLNLLDNSTVSRKYKKINEKPAVFSKMLNVEYTTADDVKEAFEDAVDAVYNKENKKSSGSGGGGGKTYIASVPPVSENVSSAEKLLFTDISSADNAMLKALADARIVAGYGDGTFRPQSNVRRDEFMKMLVVALGIENSNAVADFYDVPVGNWAYSYVASAYNAGITTGVSATLFAPDANINRQDVITMIYRACKSRGLIPDAVSTANVDLTGVADYAIEAVNFVYSNVTSPDANGIRPNQPATRIETAKLLYDFISFIKGGKQ